MLVIARTADEMNRERENRKKIKEVLTRFRYFGYKRRPTPQFNSTLHRL
jgi:hypothetical protein